MKAKKFLAAALAGAATLATAGVAGATSDATANRMEGAHRYATAGVVAESTFGDSGTVVLASGEQFPDALAASYISGVGQMPLLLTPAAGLPDGLTDTLAELGADGVQIVGGTAAVSDQVAAELTAAGYVPDRVAGADRYATARTIAELFPVETIGEFGEGRAAIVATGQSFADALAAAPLSAKQRIPIVLTGTAELHAQAEAALDNLDIDQVLIVGGTLAVSPTVEDQIEADGIAVQRVSGETRQETATELAELALDTFGFSDDRVLVARGDAYPDALVGGARGGFLRVPLLLTDDEAALGTQATGFISDHSDTIAAIDILGGEAAVSTAAENAAVTAARGG